MAIAALVGSLAAVALCAAPAGATFPSADNGVVAWDRGGDILTKPSPSLASPESKFRAGDGPLEPTDSQVSFSPDGTRVAFVREAPNPEIFIARADGRGAAVQITDNGAVNSNPVWSPDGTRIAWVYLSQIWMMFTNGTGQVQLTGGSAATGDHVSYDPEDPAVMPSWSVPTSGFSDGSIAFIHNGFLWTMDSDGTDKQPVPHECPVETGICDPVEANPDWSPDGGRIAFEYLGDIFTVAPGASPADAVALAGTENGRFPGAQLDPAWSPDGSMIAFESAAPASDYELGVASAAGTDAAPTLLTDHFGDDLNPAWQPRFEYTRALTIAWRAKQRTFRGKLTSARLACARAGWQVKVLRVKPGADRVVARAKTKANGSWSARERKAKGRYYAVVEALDVVGTGHCLSARSKTVRAKTG